MLSFDEGEAKVCEICQQGRSQIIALIKSNTLIGTFPSLGDYVQPSSSMRDGQVWHLAFVPYKEP